MLRKVALLGLGLMAASWLLASWALAQWPGSHQPVVIQVDVARRWTDTGLEFRAGATMEIRAWGEACYMYSRCCGPEGIGNRATPGFLLPGASQQGLIGRIGGRVFFIGAGFRGQAPASGRLSLAMNESNCPTCYDDNSGSWTVEVGAPRGGPGRRPDRVVIQVDVRHRWTDAGFELAPRQPLRLVAHGRACYDAGGHCVGPEGQNVRATPEFVLPGAPRHGLLGRVGSRVFFLGGRYQGQAPQPGRLYLGMNESNCPGCWEDNSGYWTVELEPGY